MGLLNLLPVLVLMTSLVMAATASCPSVTKIDTPGTTVYTPGYPKSLSTDQPVTCEWTVELGFAFKRIDVELAFSARLPCNAQSYVHLTSDNGGDDKPCDVASFDASYTASVTIRYVLDPSQPLPAFGVYVQMIHAQCPEATPLLVATDTSQPIRAAVPPFESGEVLCQWKITSTQGTSITVNVLSGSSRVFISDLSPVYGNSVYDKGYKNQILVNFRVTPSRSYQGFHLTYQAPDSAACTNGPRDIIATDSRGHRSIALQGYPGNGGLTCSWSITSIRDILQVSVMVVDLEHNQGQCISDYVEFFDGWNSSNNTRSLARLCTADSPKRTFRTTGKKLFISFHSNHFVQGKRLEIFYQSQYKSDYDGCGQGPRIVKSSYEYTEIKSLGYPFTLPAYSCSWKITSDSDLVRIYISADMYRSQNRSNTNCSAYIDVYDGPSPDATHLGTTCSDSDCAYSSSGKSFFLKFHSETLTSSRFTIGYKSDYRPSKPCPNIKLSRCPNSNKCGWRGYCSSRKYCMDANASTANREVVFHGLRISVWSTSFVWFATYSLISR